MILQDPEPQKKETPEFEMKETCRVKVQNRVQDKSEEAIPLLVPTGKSPTKENVEIQKHATGKKSPRKGPGLNTYHAKKRKVFTALETLKGTERKTPGKGPGKSQESKKSQGMKLSLGGKKTQVRHPKSQRPGSLPQLINLQEKLSNTQTMVQKTQSAPVNLKPMTQPGENIRAAQVFSKISGS